MEFRGEGGGDITGFNGRDETRGAATLRAFLFPFNPSS
jgi:hypothetical protein